CQCRGRGFEPWSWRIPHATEQLVGPVVAQHPSDEQSQQEEPPTESQDSLPGQEREDEGASVVEGPDLEVDRQELTQPKTGVFSSTGHKDGKL
uniref:GAGE domain-containing protein n=1 Tax=Balaenoptera musculus TaxID=9771 RepID=A0A8C0D333_BALMU